MRTAPIALAAAAVALVAAASFIRPSDQPGWSEVEGIEVADGLQLTVFAEAPMLTNPTNLDVDERGRVWVVEGHNYRNSLHPNQPAREEGDRVVILEDTNGDGRADRETVFYQGRDIDAAMGIVVLGNEVIVSSYGEVISLVDTDGDDRADEKRVLFRLNDADHDHTVHAFIVGPDGRYYFNVGDEGRFVLTPQGDTIVDLAGNRVTDAGEPYRKGMTYRVERDGSRFEVLGHNFRNPYEVAVDAFGTVWQSDNDDDGNRAVRINYVMEGGNYGYTDEMTGAGWRTPRTGMSDSIPLRHWHLNDPGVVPNVLQTGAGSPAGIMVYEGDLLPARYRGVMIHADPGPRVVRGYPVQSQGAGYAGRIEPMLAGTGDEMFRPVDVAAAPDGSLFIADWYDPGVGGHNVGDLQNGRILRVAPAGSSGYSVPVADLTSAGGAAEQLSGPNHARRFLAMERLRELGAEAEPALRRLFESGTREQRARALWLLAELPGNGDRYIDLAAGDADADLRITALRVARRSGRDVIPLVRRLVDDRSAAVRREAVLSLRGVDDPAVPGLWADLAGRHDGADRWYLEALGISAEGRWTPLLAAWSQRVGEGWNSAAGRDILWRARDPQALLRLAEFILSAESDEGRTRYFRAFDFHESPARDEVLLGLLEAEHADAAMIAALALTHLDASAVADDPRVARALPATLDAIAGSARFVELAERYDARDRAPQLVALALERPDESVGVAAARLALAWGEIPAFRGILDGGDAELADRAVRVLGAAGAAEAIDALRDLVLAADRPLALRRPAVEALGRTQSGERELLESVRSGRLPEDLRSVTAAVLFSSIRGGIREAAAEHLQPPAATTADGRTLPAAAELARQRGDADAGRAPFNRLCATCHVVDGRGSEFGPGLSDIGAKLSRAALYTSILEPSAGISFNYAGETLRLRDGTAVTGIVGSETETELVLRLPGGISTRYDRAEVVDRVRLDSSLMPDGLERALTEQELIDVVEYMASLR